MNMIIHQTKCPEPDASLFGIGVYCFKIVLFVIFGKEDRLAPISSLGDMMWDIGDDNSGYSWHSSIVQIAYSLQTTYLPLKYSHCVWNFMNAASNKHGWIRRC